jgi:sialic acid synthase SpsE
MLNKSITLGNRIVNERTLPYVIAEVGVNHEGSMELARKLIELCKEGGADAVKFQTYKAGKIASKHSPSYWDTTKEKCTSQFELFQKYDNFGPDDYASLAQHAKEVGIDFLSTPFDADAVDFLNPLIPFYKVASADLTNVPMLRQIASKNKPIILSTGASSLGEVDMAVDILTKVGVKDLVLLHCVLNYPTENKNANLQMIESLKRSYPQYLIGYSDHTLPDEKMLVLTSAWLKGSVVIEKHFTHDKSLLGNDHYHAMDVHDLKNFISNLKFLAEVNGNAETKHYLESELPARKNARRSIVSARAINQGETITEAMITYKRPAHGISPIHWDEVIVRKAVRAVEEDKPLNWSDLEQL